MKKRAFYRDVLHEHTCFAPFFILTSVASLYSISSPFYYNAKLALSVIYSEKSLPPKTMHNHPHHIGLIITAVVGVWRATSYSIAE